MFLRTLRYNDRQINGHAPPHLRGMFRRAGSHEMNDGMKGFFRCVCCVLGMGYITAVGGDPLPAPGAAVMHIPVPVFSAVSSGSKETASADTLPEPRETEHTLVATTTLLHPAPALLTEKESTLPKPHSTLFLQKPLSLKEAILLALRNNPSVESAELQRVEDKFALEVARNAFVPQWSIGGSATYDKGQRPSYTGGPTVNITTPLGTTISTSYSNAFVGQAGQASLTIKQPLLKGAGWDYNMNVLATAYNSEKTARLTFKNNIITAIVAVINSYRTLVQDYNNLDTQKKRLLQTEQTVQQYVLQVKVGKSAPNDLLQQEANLASTKLTMLRQQSTLSQDYQNFLQALGLSSSAKLTIDKTIDWRRYPLPNLKESIRLALLNNFSYQTAIINLRASKLTVMTAENAARWQLDLSMSTSVGLTTGTSTVPQNPGGTPGAFAQGGTGPSIGFTLNVPLNNVQAKQQIINARIALEQAKLSLKTQKTQLIVQVTNQVAQIRDQYQQIQIEEQTVKLQEASLRGQEIKLKYGQSTVFELNQMQNQLLQQQISLISDKISWLNLITTFEQTLGITLEKWGITLRY